MPARPANRAPSDVSSDWGGREFPGMESSRPPEPEPETVGGSSLLHAADRVLADNTNAGIVAGSESEVTSEPPILDLFADPGAVDALMRAHADGEITLTVEVHDAFADFLAFAVPDGDVPAPCASARAFAALAQIPGEAHVVGPMSRLIEARRGTAVAGYQEARLAAVRTLAATNMGRLTRVVTRRRPHARSVRTPRRRRSSASRRGPPREPADPEPPRPARLLLVVVAAGVSSCSRTARSSRRPEQRRRELLGEEQVAA